jgi:hypothetical protein
MAARNALKKAGTDETGAAASVVAPPASGPGGEVSTGVRRPSTSSLNAAASGGSTVDTAAILKELDKLRAAALEGTKLRDQELGKANQEVGRTKEALAQAQAQVAELQGKLAAAAAASAEVAAAHGSEVAAAVAARSAVEAELERVRSELAQARADNVKIVCVLAQTLGGKDKLVALCQAPPKAVEAPAPAPTPSVAAMLEIPEDPDTPSDLGEPEERAFALDRQYEQALHACVVPPATISTKAISVPQPVSAMKRHRQYAMALENRVDRLREALTIARDRERSALLPSSCALGSRRAAYSSPHLP